MNFEFSYPDIKKQCITMSYLNIMSFCLLSGCGNIEMPHEQELNQIYRLLKGTESNKMPKNIAFMSSLYKRCMPAYAATPATPYDFKGFYWEGKKKKKDIEPEVLAYSIICMTSIIPSVLGGEMKLANKDFIAYCLEVNAVKQACFLADFLKLGDFFFPGSDKGDSSYGEYNIVLDTENPDLRTQFHVIEALVSIVRLLRENERHPSEVISKLEKCMDILPVICENVMENVNSMSSRDLSVICLSLLKVLGHSDMHRYAAFSTVNAIGCELCERLERTGDISRNITDDSFSSFATLCNCMSCLIKLHELNPIDLYRDCYLKLYDRIDSYWDESSGLFITSGKKKHKNTFKEVSATIAALSMLRCSLTEPDLFMHVDNQLTSFYSSSIIKSRLFNNQFYPILQQDKMELHNLGSSFKDNAPVFAAYFEVKPDKKKYYCEPDIFESEEILSGCRYLLY